MTQVIVTGCPSTMGDDVQLNTTTLIRHAARTHSEQQIVYRKPNGDWDRYTYADCYARIKRAANALRGIGAKPGDRIGVLDWNSHRHFELYWAIPGIAAAMLQMNLRLAPEDLSYVVNHSEASYIAVDESLLSIAESIAPRLEHVRGWVVMTDKPLSEIETTLSPIYHYEDLLAAAEPEIDWPQIDERSAYSACYTTGTTGAPKGVYYSHRSIYLHAYSQAANLGMSINDCTMLITPMFHGNCWGLPQSAVLMANKIVLPGRFLADEIAPLTDALIAEGVTIANGAPAIFQPMLQHIASLKEKPDLHNARLLSGATEPPLSMMRGFSELTGAQIVHAYGATETTPMVAMNFPKPSLKATLTVDERWDLMRKQGLPLSGVDFKILDAAENEMPFDGTSVGEICVRGPWISTSYHNLADSAERFTDDGYWRSGDVGAIDTNGYLKVTDRIKDVIKSGGEWISSIDMENAIVGHPSVVEAAVVGIPHAKWQERPIALVVTAPGATLTKEDIYELLDASFAKWQLPDQVLFVDEIPKTSVGKFDKKHIRADHADDYAGA